MMNIYSRFWIDYATVVIYGSDTGTVVIDYGDYIITSLSYVP